MVPDFFAMSEKYKNLWGDTAALGSAGRARDMSRRLAHEQANERLLHGSDFPFPDTPLAFVQDLHLKDSLGIGRKSSERAYRLICQNNG